MANSHSLSFSVAFLFRLFFRNIVAIWVFVNWKPQGNISAAYIFPHKLSLNRWICRWIHLSVFDTLKNLVLTLNQQQIMRRWSISFSIEDLLFSSINTIANCTMYLYCRCYVKLNWINPLNCNKSYFAFIRNNDGDSDTIVVNSVSFLKLLFKKAQKKNEQNMISTS